MDRKRRYERAIEWAGVTTEPTIVDWDGEELSVVWEEESLALSLSGDGTLLQYEDDRPSEGEEVSDDELRLRAERWIVRHAGPIFDQFPAEGMTSHGHRVTYSYEMERSSLAVPHTGCRVTLDRSGRVVHYVYRGVRDVPERTVRLEEDVARRALLRDVVVERTVRDGRWVDHVRFPTYRADGETLTVVEQPYREEEDVRYVAVDWPKTPPRPLETFIDSLQQMTCLRTVPHEQTTVSVYGFPRPPQHAPHTWETYFRDRSEQTVKVARDASGRVQGLFSFVELPPTDKRWSRSARRQTALAFLETVLPPSSRESLCERVVPSRFEDEAFRLEVVDETNGVIDSVTVQVSDVTNRVVYYQGFQWEEATRHRLRTARLPSIESTQHALQEQLKATLAWEWDGETYELVYRAVGQNGRPLIGRDVETGEWLDS